MSEIPLNELITLQRGFDLPKNKRIPGNVPVVASTEIVGYHNEAKAKANGVVIGRSGSIGGGQYITEDFFPLNTTLYVKDFKGHHPRFIYYLCKSIDFSVFNSGTGVPTLNRNHLSNLMVKELDIKTEKKIAKILGDFDDKIALNNSINQTLEGMAQAVFQSWFVDFDPVRAKAQVRAAGGSMDAANRAAMQAISGKNDAELSTWQQQNPGEFEKLHTLAAHFPDRFENIHGKEIPQGWEVVPLEEVLNCFDKFRIPLSKLQRKERKGNIPYYGATSVMDYVDKYIFDGIYLLIGEDGSVLKEDGTPFVQYIWGKSWVNNHAHVLQGKNGISTEHLMTFIRLTNITPYVTGAVQPKLNQQNMNSIPFRKLAK